MTRRRQVRLAAVTAVALAILLAGTVELVATRAALQGAAEEIRDLRLGYAQLVADGTALSGAPTPAPAVTATADATADRLAGALARSSLERAALARRLAELDRLLAAEIERGEAQAAAWAVAEAGASRRAAALEATLAETRALAEDRQARLVRATRRLAEAEAEVERLAEERLALQAELALAEADRAAESEAMAARIAALEDELASERRTQRMVLAGLRQRSAEHVSQVQERLAYTGLDIEALIEQLSEDGGNDGNRGGPMVPALPGWPWQPQAYAETPDLVALIDRAADLRDIANRLPLLPPLDADFRLTSGFGGRADPINGRAARHEGLDLSAPRRTQVFAPAPGTVAFAGRRGAYGNMVEIDHGLGLATRYGHLHAIDVSVGEVVAAGDPVGLVGSTGRTTGPHLHYEIRFDGEPLDPAAFLKAGQEVLELSQEVPAGS